MAHADAFGIINRLLELGQAFIAGEQFMPFFKKRNPWEPRDLKVTAEEAATKKSRFGRRALIRFGVYGGLATAGGIGWWRWRGGDTEVVVAGRVQESSGSEYYPAVRNDRFKVDRTITSRAAAARYNNFYEFTSRKWVWRFMDEWKPGNWTIEVTGLVSRPTTFDMDDIARKFSYEERVYRHRCVEAWSMVVPWTGFPLRVLLEYVQPLPEAKYVRFVSFDHTKLICPHNTNESCPWPYNEGLTLAEATNELTFLATGIYGQPLLKQHGTPIRLVVPWKYGFKSAKSLVRIELTKVKPATFWNTMMPHEYDFWANVDPAVPHPRWSQESERDIETWDWHRTLPFNGYAPWVARLYKS